MSGSPAYQVLQAAAVAWDIRSRSWWEPELAVLPYAVRPGEQAIDVGANYGFYTYHLSRAVGPRGRVFAMEPIPATVRVLERVLRLLRVRNATVVAKGCGRGNSRLSFTVPRQASGAPSAGLAHMTDRGSGAGTPRDDGTEIVCDVVALDDLLPDLEGLSFVKCDVEGAELLALQGAVGLLRKHRPTVTCEVTPDFMAGFSLEPRDLTAFMGDLGYRVFSYRPSADPRLQPLDTTKPIPARNYLFVHDSRADRFSALTSPE